MSHAWALLLISSSPLTLHHLQAAASLSPPAPPAPPPAPPAAWNPGQPNYIQYEGASHHLWCTAPWYLFDFLHLMQENTGGHPCMWSTRLLSTLLAIKLTKAVFHLQALHLSSEVYPSPACQTYRWLRPTALLEQIWSHVKGTAKKISWIGIHRLNQIWRRIHSYLEPYTWWTLEVSSGQSMRRVVNKMLFWFQLHRTNLTTLWIGLQDAKVYRQHVILCPYTTYPTIDLF